MELKELKSIISDFPRRPGIYQFSNLAGEIIYVGKALSLKDRLTNYLDKQADPKTKTMLAEAVKVDIQEMGSEFFALLSEARLIKKFQPKYNISLKDDKSFIYVFISVQEDFPKIFVIRRPKLEAEDSAVYKNFNGIYFGPFPSANTLRRLLKTIRRIFPYCQQSRNNRPCFYSQLALCRPCPGFILRQDQQSQKNLKRKYRQNIFRIIRLFSVQNDLLKKELENEMQKQIKKLDFEAAQSTKYQLQLLENLASYSRADELLKDADKITGVFQDEADSLCQSLKPFFSPLTKITKIEAYDISNFQGSYAVGSQIVFVNGLPEKSLYKRYKIRSVSGISDVAMMAEVLERRLKHTEWEFPDLILIDGGVTQLNVGLKVQAELSLQIPMLGLAKRLEKVIVKKEDEFTEAKVSPAALNLLKRVRDEAHRFALSYHRQRFRLLTEN